jgi:quercetin dioxygenase-like cupin family protein
MNATRSSIVCAVFTFSFCSQAQAQYVRLAELEIDPAQLEAFKAAVTEGVQAAVRVEPGVLVFTPFMRRTTRTVFLKCIPMQPPMRRIWKPLISRNFGLRRTRWSCPESFSMPSPSCSAQRPNPQARHGNEGEAAGIRGGIMITRRRILAATGSMAALMTTRAAAAGESNVATQGRDEAMQITRAGSQPSNKGSGDYFTGTVRVDPLFPVREPGRVSAGSVTFEPGARTAWHTHPLGQTLIITAGMGWVQREGGPIEEVRPDDVVWFPPGLKHWHGASPKTAMTHIAIQETLNGKNVDWLEKVSDEQYRT